MKVKKIALTVLLTVVLCLAGTGIVLAMSSTNFNLPWDTPSAGGGDRGSSNYSLGDTAGQSSATGLSGSTSYRLGSGFWYGFLRTIPGPEPDIRTPIDPIDFGDVPVASMVDEASIIYNDGAVTLTINSITRVSGSAEFTCIGPATPFDIAAYGSEAVTIRFAPTSAGLKNAVFNISSNDPDEPDVEFDVSGNGTLPDLEITEKFEEWVVQGESYTISYTVTNVGTATTGASTTSIEIDGVEEATDAVPSLAAGMSHSNTFGPYTLSGDADTILICADKDDIVTESDEDNNCLQNAWGEYVISGTTGEVNCDILPSTNIEAYKGDDLKASTVSDGSGDYTLSLPETGDYDIIASKTAFRNETQQITISGSGVNTLDFIGETGLIPNAPNMSYVLGCVNHWLYPVEPCGLTMSRVLAVVNAWLYPI